MRYIKTFSVIITTLTIVMVGSKALAAPQVLADAFSASHDAACQGVSLGDATNACSTDSGGGLGTLLRDVVSILSIIVGVVAVIMIIVGGLKYITSGGDSNKTGSAKNTILYALIGLVIAALAQILVHFVLTRATNATSCPAGKTLQGAPPTCQ